MTGKRDDSDGRAASDSPNDPDDPYDYERIFEEAARPVPPLTQRIRARLALIKRIGISALIVIILSTVYLVVAHRFDPPGGPGQEVTVDIPSGTTTSRIGVILQQKKVIPSSLAFRIWVKAKSDGPFLAGEYTFHAHESVGAAIAVLVHGPKASTDRITLPEGLTLNQIAERVGSIPGMSAQRFLQVASSGEVRSDFEPSGVNNLEGFLFPDTYLLEPSETETTLIHQMVTNFDTEARDAGLGQPTPGQAYDVLKIASIIEREAKLPEDRGKISQVIENRLFQGMKLQIDATVLYAIGNKHSALTNSDLRVNSLYNTYLKQGLPPGPISNPGRASIDAALHPTPGPWIFYVLADSNGGHAFSDNITQFNKDKAEAKSKGLLN